MYKMYIRRGRYSTKKADAHRQQGDAYFATAATIFSMIEAQGGADKTAAEMRDTLATVTDRSVYEKWMNPFEEDGLSRVETSLLKELIPRRSRQPRRKPWSRNPKGRREPDKLIAQTGKPKPSKKGLFALITHCSVHSEQQSIRNGAFARPLSLASTTPTASFVEGDLVW